MNSSLHSPVPSSKSKIAKSDSESIVATPKSKTSLNPTIATQTPTQPSPLPPCLRSRRVALSLKEVRQIASRDLGTNQTKSTRRQIVSWLEDPTTTSKLHKPRKKQDRDGLTKIPDKYEMLGELFSAKPSSSSSSRGGCVCHLGCVCYICYVTLGECGSMRER